jgi:hypothetical protein
LKEVGQMGDLIAFLGDEDGMIQDMQGAEAMVAVVL